MEYENKMWIVIDKKKKTPQVSDAVFAFVTKEINERKRKNQKGFTRPGGLISINVLHKE